VHRNGAYRLVIDDVIALNGQAAIVARESRASSMWDRRPWTRYTFFIRNRTRQQAVEFGDYALPTGASLFRYLPIGDFGFGHTEGGGFSSRGMVLSAAPRYTPRGERIDIDPEWLAGAELVIRRQTQEGTVERTLDLADFPL
jgi:hypothetical protein